MAAGDEVYFYVSGAAAGIYVVGTVVAGPVKRSRPDEFGEWKVGVRYDARIDPPILRAELLAEPVLARVSLFTRWQGTNFPLERPVAKRIRQLTRGRRERVWRTEGARRERRAWRLYVLELDDEAGPGRLPDRPNLYVGQTARSVLERLGVHLTDSVIGSGKVRKHFRAIRFDLFNPSETFGSSAEALQAEAALEAALRRRGHAVVNKTGEDLKLESRSESR
jgi:hypothetical protein